MSSKFKDDDVILIKDDTCDIMIGLNNKRFPK